MRGEAPPFFLERAIAGSPHPEALGESGHRPPQELAHPRGVLAQDAPRALCYLRRRLQAGDAIRIGVVADVLAAQMRRESGAEKILVCSVGQCHRAFPELHDAAALQRVGTVFAGGGQVQHGGGP